MKKIYILSGLGADERVFKHLDFSNWDVMFIQWITPLVGEPLRSYTQRLSEQITNTPDYSIEQETILVGLSFGGIIAAEIAEIIPVKKLILISSVKTNSEIPLLYRLLGKINLHQLIPYTLLKKDHFFNRWLFGVVRKSDRNLFRKVLADTDKDFLKWAINSILKWDKQTLNTKLFHIHGSDDKILPLVNSENTIVIKNGGHLMVLDKAKQVGAALNQIISAKDNRSN